MPRSSAMMRTMFVGRVEPRAGGERDDEREERAEHEVDPKEKREPRALSPRRGTGSKGKWGRSVSASGAA
ncbi:MAG TPA: hypothetical protein VM529_00380 [Gemmata sp.]|nr:hypothetical protein [Gemmata sp.]